MQPLKSSTKVAVIGAGAAGLCSGKHMVSQSDFFKFDIFEKQDNVGGTWRYSEKVGKDDVGLPIHSSMYKNLKTNLPKEIMAFSDFPFSSCNGQSFIHHTEVLQYLKDYSKHYNLYKHIKFQKLVENVKPLKLSNGLVEWSVSFSDVISKEKEAQIYDAVMVCNGHYSISNKPDIPGLNDFEGIVMHSHDYRVASVFKGLRVVLLGAGSSGVDIALEVSSEAKEVILSHNSPPKTCPLPENLTQEKGIESVNNTSVTFIGGKTYTCDAIILCTGYVYQYPFLDPTCNIQVEDQRVAPLYLHTFHVDYPSLAIVGIPQLVIPFPLFELQVKVVLNYLRGMIELPSSEEMRLAEKKDFEKRLESGFKPRHAHNMPRQWQWEFHDYLCELGEIKPMADVVVDLYKHNHQLRMKDLLNYKKNNYCLIDDKTFVQLE